MKISIIIPVYNVENYINECLTSIFSQTYKNIEVIIIDDCGNDGSMNIVHKHIQKLPQDKRPIIINHEKNKGLSATRNTGIRRATGEYIYFIDSDDYISPHCIESFINLAIKHNFPNIIFGTATEIPFQWRNVTLSVDSPQIPDFISDTQWISINYFRYKNELLPIPEWNKLIKRDYLLKYNLFFKEGIIYEDKLWYWLIGNTTNNLVFNKECTYYYRFVPNSIINSRYNNLNLYSEMTIIKEFSKNIKLRYFYSQIKYILHYSHSLYCKTQKCKNLQSRMLRYPKAFIFLIKCLFVNPKNISNSLI